MATAKRFTFISNIEHSTDKSIKIPIEYDRKEQNFRAAYAGISYVEKTEDELRRVIGEAVRETLDVPWLPVICIQEGDRYGMGHTQNETSIAFIVSRIWVTRLPSGAFKVCKQWEAAEKGMLLNWCKPFEWNTAREGQFKPPCQRVWYAERYYYLPYTDELWERISILQEMIAELRKHLTDLFSTEVGIQQLLSTPMFLIPAPVGDLIWNEDVEIVESEVNSDAAV